MPSVKRNFFYSSVLTTANYIFPLITFPYVSRVLGVANIGLVNFVDSIINYFILFSMMGMNVVGIREIAMWKGDRVKLSTTFSSLFWLNTITTFLALVILVAVTLFTPVLRQNSDMMAIGASKLFFSYFLIEWFYKGLEKFRYITIRSVLFKFIFVISVFLFVRVPEDYKVYYLLMAMTVVVNAFVNIYYSRHYISLKIKGVNPFLYISPFCIMGIYSLLTSMYTSLNVAYLGLVSGELQVGYYTTASKIFSIIIAFFTAFTGVMMPRLSSLMEEGSKEEFYRLVEKSKRILISISIPLIVLAIIYAPAIIRIIGGKGYEGAIMPMRIMLPLIFIIGYEQIIIIQVLMPLKKDKIILINSIVGAFLGISLNIILVPFFQSIGSAFVWIISELSVMVLAQIYLSRNTTLTFPWSLFVKGFAKNMLLLIIISLCYIYITDLLFSFIIAITLTLLYYYVTTFVIFKDSEIIEMTMLTVNKLRSHRLHL